MKHKSTLRSFLAMAGSSLLAVSYVSASPYYWDSNGDGVGFEGFGTTAGTWRQTPDATTNKWSTDAAGTTGAVANYATTTSDDLFFGTSSVAFTPATTISGTVNAKSIYLCPTSSGFAGSLATINFGDVGIFETAKTGNTAFPTTVTLTGAGTSLEWKVTYSTSMSLANVTTNSIVTGGDDDHIVTGPGRLAFGTMAQLGTTGQKVRVNGGVLRFISTFPVATYPSVSSFSPTHPISFTVNKDAGFDNQSATTFTVDVPLALGTGGFSVEGNGSAVLVLNNTGNNYTGATKLLGSTLEISNAAHIGASTAPIYFNSTLKIAGANTMTTLGTRNVVIRGASTMKLNIVDAVTEFTVGQSLTDNVAADGIALGVLTGDTAGACGVDKTGLGTLVLSGNSSYTGTTTVGGGTLRLGNTNALGAGSFMGSTVVAGTTVSSGFTLDLNGITGVNEIVSLNGTGIGTNGALINSSTPASIGNSGSGGIVAATVAATGSGSGYSTLPAVVISGTGAGATATASLGVTASNYVVNISGNRNYSVAPVVTIGGGGGTGATATPILSGGATGTVIGLTITKAGTGYTTAPTAVVSGGTSTGTTTTTFTGNATNFCVGGLNMTAVGSGYTGTPTFTFNAVAQPATAHLFSPVILATNSSIGGTGDITINGAVLESGGVRTLTKVGAGKLTLSGNNTYTGLTTVSTGTLSGNGNYGGSVTIAATGTHQLAVAATTGAQDTSVITGTLDVTGSTLDLTAAATPADGVYVLATASVGITGTPTTINYNGITGLVSVDTVSTPKRLLLTVNAAPPTLTSIADDQMGGPVAVNTLVTYTVTFSEDIDASTVTAADFSDAGGDVSLTIGTIMETSPGVFSVQVTPTSAGTLNLQIPTSAVITDSVGSLLGLLDNDPALPDDTAITVTAGAPEIDVNQGGDIANAGSKGFGTVTLGSNSSLIFTINNTGTAALNLSGTPLVDVTGANAADFTVTAVPSTPVAGPGNTTFTVQFAPLGTLGGARNALLTIANDDSDEGTFTINVSGTAQTQYEAWAGGALFNNDANGDGVKNGLAFLLGASGPSGAVTQPTVTESGGNLLLSNFLSRNDASRGTATLYVQHSSDLGISDAWVSVPVTDAGIAASGVTFSVTTASPNNTVTATISSSEAAGGKLFGRLNASPTP
jgi:autotransporter-associated beta strand protein